MMAFIEQEANEKAEEIDAKVMKLKIKRNKMMIKKIRKQQSILNGNTRQMPHLKVYCEVSVGRL